MYITVLSLQTLEDAANVEQHEISVVDSVDYIEGGPPVVVSPIVTITDYDYVEHAYQSLEVYVEEPGTCIQGTTHVRTCIYVHTEPEVATNHCSCSDLEICSPV